MYSLEEAWKAQFVAIYMRIALFVGEGNHSLSLFTCLQLVFWRGKSHFVAIYVSSACRLTQPVDTMHMYITYRLCMVAINIYREICNSKPRTPVASLLVGYSRNNNKGRFFEAGHPPTKFGEGLFFRCFSNLMGGWVFTQQCLSCY